MQIDLLNIALALIILILATIMVRTFMRLSTRSTRQPYGGTSPFVPEQELVALPGGGYRARYVTTSLEQTLSLQETVGPDSIHRRIDWAASGAPDAVLEAEDRMAAALTNGLAQYRLGYLPYGQRDALSHGPHDHHSSDSPGWPSGYSDQEY